MVWLFALIRTRPCEKVSPVERVLRHVFKTRGIVFEVNITLGVRTLECTVDVYPGEIQRKTLERCDRALKLIARKGIRTVVPSDDFPVSDLSGYRGLSLPDIRRMWRGAAGKIALFISGDGDSCRHFNVALYANRLNSEIDRAVRCLLPKSRNLAIYCAYQGEEYARLLLREFGVAVRTDGAAASEADLHLFFDPPSEYPAMKRSAIAVVLFPGNLPVPRPCRTVSEILFRWPDNLPRPEGFSCGLVLAALSGCGAVSAEVPEIEQILLTDADV